MAKKRASATKRRRKSSGTSLKKTLEAAITSNPFLNFFLSKCRVKGNAKLHKFAKRAGDEWKDMSYQEKTPYYLLADKARTTSVRKKSRRRRYSESDVGEGSFSMITLIKKPDSTNDDKDQEDNAQNDQQNPEGSKVPETSSVKIEEPKTHNLKPHTRKHSDSTVSSPSSFHSMVSDDSVERDSKRRGKNSRSWTDSFDYMN